MYEVAFWRSGEPRDSAEAWTDAVSSTSQTINPGSRTGSYRWGVWLGQFNAAGKYERIRFLGGDRTFDVTSGGSNNQDSGSSGTGGSGGTEEKGG